LPQLLAGNRQPNEFNNLKNTTRSQIGGAIPLFCMVCALATPMSLFAIGIRLPDQDAFATARGNAFAATANDPAAVYYNPAGITQLDEFNLSLGTYGVELASHYTSTGPGPGFAVDSHEEWAALPQVFATMSLTNCHLAFGLGFYSPYGSSMDWSKNAPWVGFVAPKSGEIDYLRVNPVVAYQPCSTLSIAAGVMIDYSDAELKRIASTLRGDDTDAGFNVGALWHPSEQHSFGLTYRSATDMNYTGHLSSLHGTLPASFNYNFPQTAVAGYSYRPTPDWNLEADVDWTDWKGLQTVTIQTPHGQAGAIPFNWTTSTMLEFGATRYFGSGWRASAGYMYSMNSVPASSFNALVPDSDRHLFSIGLGKTYNHLSLDAAYQLGYGPDRTITGDGPYNGKYEFFSNALSLNIGWHF
jgi:long-chain fatty acid transport protein